MARAGAMAGELRPLLAEAATTAGETGWHARHDGLLLLGREHGYEPMRQAIEQALSLGGSDVAVIRYLLERTELRAPAAALEVGWLDRYERPLPNLQDYDRLLTATGTGGIQ